jgi:chromate transporter
VVITVAFIGYVVAGFTGAVAAAVGIFGPVYLMVVVLAPVFRRHSKNPMLRSFVAGVTAAAVGAIAGAVVVLARRSIHDWPGVGIAAAAVPVLLRWRVPEPALIGAGAAIGIVVHSIAGFR